MKPEEIREVKTYFDLLKRFNQNHCKLLFFEVRIVVHHRCPSPGYDFIAAFLKDSHNGTCTFSS